MARISERRVDKDPGWIERRFREVEEKIAGKLGANTPIPGGVTTVTQVLTSPTTGLGFVNTDTATAAADDSAVTLTLSFVPIARSLHVRQNGLDLDVTEWSRESRTVTISPSATLVIRSGDMFSSAYAYETLNQPHTDENYITAVLADSPVLYATLSDEAATTAADLSGNGHDGTYGGSVAVSRDALAPGLPGTSVDFTAGGWVEFAPAAAWQRTAPFTVEVWIQLDNQHVTTEAVIAACDDFGSSDTDRIWALAIPSSGATNSIEASVQSGTTGTTAADTVEIVIGQTYYLVMDFDGTDLRMFVDNALVDTSPITGALNTSTLWPLTLGATASGQFGRHGETYGRLQHFALYDAILTDERRAAHYAIGTAG